MEEHRRPVPPSLCSRGDGTITRTRRTVASLAVAALLLAGCQTTGDDPPSGAAAGALTGAASGAGAATGIAIASGGFSGQNTLLGLLVGAVVGGVAGHYMSSGDNSGTYGAAERDKADEAAMKILTDPTLKIVHWESEASSRVFGWAEPSTDGVVKVKKGCRAVRSVRFVNGLSTDQNTQFCRDGDKWIKS
ncbi:MAG: hypothetical protein RLO51_20800 [Thalassobaculum sp.]|uniref:hypothetical protein n=1 Tax=Thalassobaculum sp. TaxID=2022740 RepID=UPI0032EBDF2F